MKDCYGYECITQTTIRQEAEILINCTGCEKNELSKKITKKPFAPGVGTANMVWALGLTPRALLTYLTHTAPPLSLF